MQTLSPSIARSSFVFEDPDQDWEHAEHRGAPRSVVSGIILLRLDIEEQLGAVSKPGVGEL